MGDKERTMFEVVYILGVSDGEAPCMSDGHIAHRHALRGCCISGSVCGILWPEEAKAYGIWLVSEIWGMDSL